MFNIDGNLIKVRLEDVKNEIKNQPKGLKIIIGIEIALILCIGVLTVNFERKLKGKLAIESINATSTPACAGRPVYLQMLLGPPREDNSKNILDWRIIQSDRQLTCVKQSDQDSIRTFECK